MERLSRVVSHVQGLEVKGQSSPFGPAASTSTHCSTHLLHNGQIALLTINNAPVNSLNDSVFSDIRTHFDAAEKDPAVKAIVFTGAGRTFSCGADLNMIAGFQQEFLEGKVQDGANVRNMLLRNHELLNRIENGAKPTVAMVNGPALGGGCELAMSCNQRVCFKAASFSLPELSLGLIPGLGGCVRLPRLIGLDKAVTHTVSGKSINAKNALKWGLVMSVAKKPAQLFEQAVKVALGMAAGKVPRNMALLNDAKIGTAAQTELVIDTAKQSKAMRRSKNPSVIATYLEVARLGALYGGNVGLQREIDSFIKAVNSPGAHGLVYAFLTSRACATIPGLNWKAAKKVKTVAVLGAGTMGGGIAIALLSSGYKVILTDINQASLERGVAVIVSNVKRLLKRRKMNLGAMEFILRNLHPQTNWDGFDQVDCVIEAAVENIKIKQNIFEKLEKACPNASILATNTSTIDLNEVGLKMQSKSKLVGLHFFSPAHIMPLLEIIRIEDTSEQCIATCMTLAKKIKKTPVLVKNCVGFTANRMFFPYGQAGCLLLEHGISPYRIDKALETFGMPMGVFKMCDLSGLDISVHVGGIMRSAYGERSYGSKANDQLVNAKRLGQKNGLGWYDYKKNRPVPNPKVVAPLIAQAQAEAKVPASRIEKASKSLSDADLVEILLFTIANEGFRILDEGLAIREGDIDVCSVAGYGFPSVRGGVIKHARTSGLKYVVDRLNFYANFFEEQRIRNFFAPCARLVQEAKNSRT